jgi:hypothetical protein
MLPLPVKSGLGGFTRLSQVILAKSPDGSMPAHTKGHEGNLPVETHIRSLRMAGPLGGASGAPTASHALYRFIPHSGVSGRL